ncbi:hypothetical protein HK104_003332 [Borealophlyctis nickersoniae]|nr:hypothetical protein HK104_003332 [Borealophlyctis nickersoniae]
MAHSPAIPAMDQEMYQYEAMQGDPGMEAVVMPGSRRGSTASTIARALVGTGAATSLTAADIARDMKLLREVLKEKRPGKGYAGVFLILCKRHLMEYRTYPEAKTLDDKVLIQILGFATPEQCHQLALAYKGYYGVALPEALKHSLSGSFGKMCVALATPLPDYDAMWVHDAVSGIGTNEDILMEILVGRSNAEIKAIMHSYKMIYGKDLEQVIGSELKHHLKKLFVVLLQAQRDETGQILDVEEDVEALFQAAKSRSHKDQCVFISTLCNRSDAHLLTMFEAYHRKHGITVEELIKKEFRGDLEKSMLALVHSIQNRPAHVADLFNQAIHGGHFGKPDDDKLIRLTVRHRHPRVMALVREAYAAVWGQSLYRKVEDATKGEFRRLLLACIGLDLPGRGWSKIFVLIGGFMLYFLTFLLLRHKSPPAQYSIVSTSVLSASTHPPHIHRICTALLPAVYTTDVLAALRKAKEPYWVPRQIASFGFGPPVSPVKPEKDRTLWLTHQFALDIMFYHRMKASPFGTHDCANADAVYVPALIGSEYTFTIHNRRDKDLLASKFWNNITRLFPYINTKPHLVILGRVESDWRQCTGENKVYGSRLLCEMRHPNLWFGVMEKERGRGPSVQELRTIDMPYPAKTHFLDPVWPGWNVDVGKKDVIVYATWQTRTGFRKKLADQCLERGVGINGTTDLAPLLGAEGNSSKCIIYEAPADGAMFDNARSRGLSARSIFCPQPAGDTLSRSQTWDALLAICIPVFFGAVPMPWSDRLPWSNMTVSIPRNAYDGGNFVDYLASIPPTRVAAMQQTISQHRHLFQYSIRSIWPEKGGWTWDEVMKFGPEDDAFTGVLKDFILASTLRGTVNMESKV